MDRNLQFHGFQFYKTLSGNDFPSTIRGRIASAYATDLYRGQPVVRQSDGTYQRVAAGGGAGISGVISNIIQFRNANGVLVTNGRHIPSGTSYTNASDATMVEIIPARGHLFRVCGVAAGTNLATSRAWEGENADHVYGPTGGAADTALGLNGTFLDIATHNTTATLQWRLVEYLGDMGGWGADNQANLAWQQWVVYPNVIVDVGGLPAVLGV